MRNQYSTGKLGTIISVELTMGLALLAAVGAIGQQPVQPAPTAPANESRRPTTVRSPNSSGADLAVPLCESRFHDSLARNGIANAHEARVIPPEIKTKVPAQITREAINAGSTTHITNYLVVMDVVVDTEGHPTQACLAQSSGYGLDASAATAVEQYRWEPATRSGRPVKMRTPVHFQFVNPLPPPRSPARP
jgi:TonB family protein